MIVMMFSFLIRHSPLWQVAQTGFDHAPLAALKAKGIPHMQLSGC